MSVKIRDQRNRWRRITVGFRVSPEESEQLSIAVALSGLPKQEYCYRRCMQRDIVVQGNPRVYKALEEVGYDAYVGYELFPATTTAEAVKAIMTLV